MSELQAEHDQAVAALEEKVSESLELAEQVGADQDVTLAALRAQMAASHADEIAELRAQLSEAERAVEATEAASKELSNECEARSAEVESVKKSAAEVAEELDVARGRKEDLERELADNVAAGKATEEQLRHRLTSQVAEAENLRQELLDTRERSDRAEAAVRASDQRARESADEKTKGSADCERRWPQLSRRRLRTRACSYVRRRNAWPSSTRPPKKRTSLSRSSRHPWMPLTPRRQRSRLRARRPMWTRRRPPSTIRWPPSRPPRASKRRPSRGRTPASRSSSRCG
ncbi:unnamed protein product [Ectocarpus sp. 12 AP-2014]